MTLATIDVGNEHHAAARRAGWRRRRGRADRRAGGDHPAWPGHRGRAARWDAAGIEATLAALRAYADIARRAGARIAAVGTEALRRAPNGADFLRPAAEILGVPIEVIDGQREAALTFRAVIESFPEMRRGDVVVVDIGGGSTEVVTAHDGRPTSARSLPLGSVRLTEQHIRHDPPTPRRAGRAARRRGRGAQRHRFPAGARVVGVAGTVTSLAAMAESMATYDPERVHGYRLSRAALDGQIARLAVEPAGRPRADRGAGPPACRRDSGRCRDPGRDRGGFGGPRGVGQRSRDSVGFAARTGGSGGGGRARTLEPAGRRLYFPGHARVAALDLGPGVRVAGRLQRQNRPSSPPTSRTPSTGRSSAPTGTRRRPPTG